MQQLPHTQDAVRNPRPPRASNPVYEISEQQSALTGGDAPFSPDARRRGDTSTTPHGFGSLRMRAAATEGSRGLPNLPLQSRTQPVIARGHHLFRTTLHEQTTIARRDYD